MSEQYCLFDDERAAEGGGPYKEDERAADSRPYEAKPAEPTRRGWRGPESGMRFLRLGLADRSSIVIETALSMFELSNELRSKAKVTLTLADGRSTEVRSLDVAYLENVYSVRV